MELKPKTQFLPHVLPEKFDVKIKSKNWNSQDTEFKIPGDKSISQRAIFLNALAKGEGKIHNISKSEDVYSCISALKQLGVPIQWNCDDLVVKGIDLTGLKPSENDVFLANTATSARIMMSVMAGSPNRYNIYGNPYLSSRPMVWVATHLTDMGAQLSFTGREGYLPLEIRGKYPLNPIAVNALVPSAQEKSAVLFAGMFSDGKTRYIQQCQSRDHTERMMKYFGLPIAVNESVTEIEGMHSFSAKDVSVPGDLSSAAFLITAYLVHNTHIPYELKLTDIGTNPTRTGYLKALKQMRASIELVNEREVSGEPIADIRCTPVGKLKALDISGVECVQSLIDEIPLLALVSAFADGTTVIHDCEDLKDKDTNRIKTISQILRKFGVKVETSNSQITIHGGSRLYPTRVSSFGDHRIAMTAMVLASSLPEYSCIENCECISISYPTFLKDISNFADIRIIPRA